MLPNDFLGELVTDAVNARAEVVTVTAICFTNGRGVLTKWHFLFLWVPLAEGVLVVLVLDNLGHHVSITTLRDLEHDTERSDMLSSNLLRLRTSRIKVMFSVSRMGLPVSEVITLADLIDGFVGSTLLIIFPVNFLVAIGEGFNTFTSEHVLAKVDLVLMQSLAILDGPGSLWIHVVLFFPFECITVDLRAQPLPFVVDGDFDLVLVDTFFLFALHPLEHLDSASNSITVGVSVIKLLVFEFLLGRSGSLDVDEFKLVLVLGRVLSLDVGLSVLLDLLLGLVHKLVEDNDLSLVLPDADQGERDQQHTEET